VSAEVPFGGDLRRDGGDAEPQTHRQELGESDEGERGEPVHGRSMPPSPAPRERGTRSRAENGDSDAGRRVTDLHRGGIMHVFRRLGSPQMNYVQWQSSDSGHVFVSYDV
jgi:hypothetical protein